MPLNRYFIDSSLESHKKIKLEKSEFFHLAKVMRAKTGDLIEIINGQNVLAIGVILNIDKTYAQILIKTVISPKRNFPKIILAQGLPTLSSLNFIIQKGTELGVDEFWLFPSKLSPQKTTSPHLLNRLSLIAIAAIKQCGRLDLPKIFLLEDLKKCAISSKNLFFGDIRKNAPLLLEKLSKSIKPICIFIGPEGGFCKEEIDYLEKIKAKGVKLHENILRTETASLAALSILYQSYLTYV